MPAERLVETPIVLNQFDVGGQDSEHVSEFVRHVGLALQRHDGVTRQSSAVQLVHMGPPFARDEDHNVTSIQSVGTAQLTADELLQIGLFVDELIPERDAAEARALPQYIIHPHSVPPSEQFPFWRFSCSGFAIEAYQEAGISLVHVNDDLFPLISLPVLKQAYSDLSTALDHERIRKRYGLEGHGPWPVVLAGYVINSLSRNVAVIRDDPYQVRPGDEYFPPRRPCDTTIEDEPLEIPE